MAGAKDLTWEAFRERRLKPLEQAGGRLVWQYGENEEFVRVLLDDSIERGGYAAISTHHFGNPDFILNQPFLYRYRHHIPFISLQDAHGNESWWWSENLTGFRTFFLAQEPTWDAWLSALKNNWVCAVRHDAVTEYRTRIYGGAPGVQELVREREAQWKWWGAKPDQMIRPWLAVAVIKPADSLETPVPERGVNIRVRLWHQSTNSGVPKQPMVELVRVSVDGSPVEAKRVDKPGGQRGQGDHYHLVELPDLKPGPHTVTAVAQHLESKQEMTKQIRFALL